MNASDRKRNFTLSETALASRLEFKGKILGLAYRQELLEKAKSELTFINAHNLRTIYFNNPDYPRRLLECDDAPAMLFALGDTDLNASHMVSIVGTRNATRYGVSFIENLVTQLANSIDNLVVVSGLAFGCDITAHKQAMAMGIPTVAVVAHGLDSLYPSEHRAHAAKMVRQGAQSSLTTFMARNRIAEISLPETALLPAWPTASWWPNQLQTAAARCTPQNSGCSTTVMCSRCQDAHPTFTAEAATCL